MSGGNVLNVIRCTNTRRIVRVALDRGWEWIGYTRSGHVELRWPATDTRIHCATTPSDSNSWKQLARTIKRVSGVETWEKGNHRRSRKPRRGPDPEVEASRRRHAAMLARREQQQREAREAERRQWLGARVAEVQEQHRLEIESLMQPGWGR